MTELLILNPEQVTSEELRSYPTRTAARGVVMNEEGMIALLHVSRDKYYKLPGGGVDEGESLTNAFIRECKEEIGRAVSSIEELGRITEYRKFCTLKQISHCFITKAEGETLDTALTEHEIERGFEPPIWVTLDTALQLMNASAPTTIEGREYIVPRDVAILSVARDYISQ